MNLQVSKDLLVYETAKGGCEADVFRVRAFGNMFEVKEKEKGNFDVYEVKECEEGCNDGYERIWHVASFNSAGAHMRVNGPHGELIMNINNTILEDMSHDNRCRFVVEMLVRLDEK